MKSIYFWIVAALISLNMLPASADNIQFTVSVPNASGIKCEMNGELKTLVNGVNEFDVAPYTNITFSGINPWRISGVTDKNGTAVGSFYSGMWYLTAMPTTDYDAGTQGQAYSIQMINLDEFRNDSMTINVDDPELVNVMLGGYDTNLTLEQGQNTIKFDSVMESYLTINQKTSAPIYKVEYNGTTVASQGNSYYISDLEDGAVIDITAVLPDEDRTVSFSYSENALGSISVSVNNVAVEDFNNETLVVKIGSSVTISPKDGYKYTSVTVNGKDLGGLDYQGKYSFYSSTFTVLEDSEVYVDAAPYGNIKATVIVTDPRYVTLYKGYTYQNDIIPLQAGENIIELQENNSLVSWEISGEAIVNEVSYNGQALSSYTTQKDLDNGSTLLFDLSEKVFDKTAVVWIDNTKGQYCSPQADGSGYGYFNFNSPAERNLNIELENGYNFVSYYEGMNPFSISWYSTNPDYLQGSVYLNDKLLSPQYENSTSYSFDLAEDDVLKIFMDGKPVDCEVAIELADDVEATVVKDIVTEVTNPAAGFSCFKGTKVTISGRNLKIEVGGVALTPDSVEKSKAPAILAEGVNSYSFEVTDPSTKVSVALDTPSAISSIETANSSSDVYNTMGAKVGNSSTIDTLTPGIYIVKGKKVVVK